MIEVRLSERLSEQDTVRHVLDHGLVGGAILEPDGVSDLLTEFYSHLI